LTSEKSAHTLLPMGANGNKQQERCHRNHKLEGRNVKQGTGGGRRCRACERALSAAHNSQHRMGIILSETEVNDLADHKYAVLRG
jgi:hypothetical protein